MSDSIQVPLDSKSIILKLRSVLDRVSKRIGNSNNTSISNSLAEINSAFSKFFDTLSEPSFKPDYLISGDPARSEIYNSNLKSIYNDIDRFYKELKILADTELKSFNFSQILVSEVLKKANELSSIVLDLNILNSFNRSDMLVAGDDFKNTQFIDTEAPNSSTNAELVTNGNGIGLSRQGTRNVIEGSKIEVFPISPIREGQDQESVPTNPTAGNVERFYEGNFYNFIGLARPEGGSFNLKYIVDTSKIKDTEEVTDSPISEEEGFVVELGATEEQKLNNRQKMFDGDPSTFWECEYLYRSPSPLIDDIVDSVVEDNESNQSEQKSGTLRIDLVEAERRARSFDTDKKDLVIDLIITLQSPSSVNYLAINPVIFGSESFPEVEDIATASSNDGDFITVDGWDTIKFPKTITPEANEFLTDSQLGVTLSPSRNSYFGQGIYPFPVRIAKKIKVRIRSRYPVASPYERTYVLLKKRLDVETKITTTTKRGLFR